ncbi:MAG: hypothetical protein QOC96_3687 [Acidobacteriota bacterium]|jgi:hypothetical protein|nr:hypothetical protein [Acidobacteriota bacterium]
MSQPKCSCENLKRLEGASVPAYIAAYLEQVKGATQDEKHLYRCRICGRKWERYAPEDQSEGKRPSLIRQNEKLKMQK